MKIIEIKSIKAFNELPDAFDEPTEIRIKIAKGELEIRLNKKNGIYIACDSSRVTACESSQVRAYGSSQVRAYGSSQVTACDSSRVTACESSRVTACGSPQVRAYGSSQVTACDSSRVTACESSRVTACDSSRVTACGSSQVRAYGSSQVTACDSSQVTAYDSSRVTAYDSSRVTACGSSVKIKELLHNSILINYNGADPKMGMVHDTAQIIKQAAFIHTKESFTDIYPADKDGYVTLYKVTRDDGTDHHTGKIKYEGVVECPDFDPDPDRQCGGGLHLSPRPELALRYNSGPVKKCRAHLDDIVIYGPDITKVRCRKVEVIG